MTRPVASIRPTPGIKREPVKASGRPCPLCKLPTWERIRGEWCPRCKGWLVEDWRVDPISGRGFALLTLDQRRI